MRLFTLIPLSLIVGTLMLCLPLTAATPPDALPLDKTSGIVFKLNNNCGSKQAVEVNGKAFQIANGSSRRFDYAAGTKVYKLENGTRGQLLYTIGSNHAGKVLPICP